MIQFYTSGEYEGCTCLNCKYCKYCRDNSKYGGPGKLKKACIQWKCVKLPTKSDKKIHKKKVNMNESGKYAGS